MKRLYFLFPTLLTTLSLFAQNMLGAPFTTNGNNIIDPCGNVFIPRGVNYALLDDWDFPGNLNNGALSAAIIQANPNTVRIQWYVDYGQPNRPSYSLHDLDSVISRFERAGIVTILEMHDVTCTNNWNGMMQVIQYWTSSPMVQLIHQHRQSIMVNIANEYGQVAWTVHPNISYTEWLNDYQTAIQELRQAGIKVPLIIDAPDCGTSINWLLQAGNDLLAADSLHNLILSVHAYFADYSATEMTQLATTAANSSLPVIFGEIANIQDATGPCSDTITHYPALLQACQDNGVGWLAWVWTDDQCNGRRLSTNGLFSNLTPYGNDIVNNNEYGLAQHAEKACFDPDTGTAIRETKLLQPGIVCYPNPTSNHLVIVLQEQLRTTNASISFWNIRGQQLKYILIAPGSPKKIMLDISSWPTGIYWLQYTADGAVIRKKFIRY